MDKYIGTKKVEAEPMTRGDFNRAKGVDIPRSDAAFSEQGYLVRYPDGYVSWSPKAAFENAYSKAGTDPLADTALLMRSEDFKERFEAEYRQVKIRFERLRRMIVRYEAGTLPFTPKCPVGILKDQAAAMEDYLYALEVRAELEGIAL